ncbi:hypothetical protein [Blastococcus sp. SYSU DS0619]
MSRPEGPEGRESVWARIEREDREDAERNFWPLMLIRTAILWFLLPSLVELFGRPLPRMALWVASCLTLVQLLVGWLWYRSNRRRP